MALVVVDGGGKLSKFRVDTEIGRVGEDVEDNFGDRGILMFM